MAAAALLHQLLALGLTLNAAGDHLQVSPASLLTDPLRAAMREHKAGLLALVTVCPQPLEVTPETPLLIRH